MWFGECGSAAGQSPAVGSETHVALLSMGKLITPLDFAVLCRRTCVLAHVREEKSKHEETLVTASHYAETLAVKGC